MQIIGNVFEAKAARAVFLQRKFEKILIVRLLQNMPAFFQQFLIYFQKIAVGQPLRRIAQLGKRRRKVEVYRFEGIFVDITGQAFGADIEKTERM